MSTLPERLRIVHVVFSSKLAGGEQHCIDLAHAQADLGHEVHIVGTQGSAMTRFVRPEVRYHGLALPILRGARLRHIVKRLSPDVCHGHLGPACKAVATVPDVARLGTLHVGFKAHQHRRLDALVCVNQAQQSQLNGFGGVSRVIHNWAPERTAAPVGPGLRAELGLQADQLLVGTAGRLHASKGMDLLVLAFKHFAPADAVLAILGEGEQREQLEKLAEGDPRIRLLGFRSDVDAALAAMDLYVSPSREEAFPLSVLEAMRAGLPIVATRTQGLTELLAGQPGTLTPIGDAEALGAAIRSALDVLRSCPKQLRQAVTYELKRFDRSAAVASVMDFYAEAIARRSSARPAPLDLELAPTHV